ncbi:MaoC family dehydratase [Paludibacterium paludis]|uniref:Acyl dehydratase n=1 Tax=Paludibacterium paludis TaxID=1225769 RepID=A0A918UA40_9NEIS|nr:MaoC family dehydratase [Paludibacterium paludis]GGY19211.1 acyl dehydratase [Paludibacterium paludis]
MLYFEDFTPGRRFDTPSCTVTAEEIIEFATKHDPQPFHTDPVAAKRSLFDGLAASGWHTSALTMGLLSRSELAGTANGMIGMQVDKMRWPRPTRPGDTLTASAVVIDRKPSTSQPGFGVVRLAWETRNQNGEIAVRMETTMWVARRGRDTPG